MAKNSITDYSKTASLNTDIQSVDIDEGCLPSGINNAIRELMADLAAVNDGTVSLTSPAFAAASLTGDLSFGDNDKAIFGAGSDLQIFHDGSHSNIKDAGTGNLRLQGDNLVLQNSDATKNYAVAVNGGAIDLRHNNSVKLTTTATGIDVTGTVTADRVVVSDGLASYISTFENTQASNAGHGLYVETLYNTISNQVLRLESNGGSNIVANFAGNGDVSFYEGTGTTPKFFWDASAESLGLSKEISFTNTANTSGFDIGLVGGDADATAFIYQRANDSIRFGSNNILRAQIAASGDISFYNSAGTSQSLFWDASAERLGLGTSAPAAQLDISSATTSTLRLSNTDTVLTQNQITGQIEFYQSDVTSNPTGSGTGITGKIAMRSVPALGGGYFGIAADMDFNVSGQAEGYASDNATLTAMTIQAGSGFVGIGTSSPATALDVAGTITADSINFNGLSPTVAYDFSGNGSVTSADGLDYLQMGSGTATGVDISSVDTITPSWSALSGSIYSNNKFRIMSARGNSTDALRIVSSLTAEGHGDTTIIGNVEVDGVDTRIITGLGISGDNINLLSDGSKRLNIASNGDISFYEDTGTTAKLFWDASAERLGLGTSSPTEVLQLNGATNAQIRMQPSATGTSGFINTTAGSTKGMVQYNHSSDYMRIYTNGSERMRIDSSGNVLVGTTSVNPGLGNTNEGHSLNASGTAVHSADGNNALRVNRNTSDGTVITIAKDGTTVGVIGTQNWGIGTSSPATYGVDNAEDLVIGQGDGNHGITISSFNTSNGTIAFTDTTNATVGRGFVDYDHNVDAMSFGTLSSERLRIDSSGRSLFRTTVTENSSVVVTPDTNRGTIMHVASDSISGTGSAKMMEGAYTVVGNSSNTVLSIPVTSQGSVWKSHFIELNFVTGEYNKSGGTKAGYCKLSLHSLTSLGSLTQHEVGGNVSSVSSSGMNILINFTSGYISGLSDNEGVLVYAKVLSTNPDYIQLDNATFN